MNSTSRTEQDSHLTIYFLIPLLVTIFSCLITLSPTAHSEEYVRISKYLIEHPAQKNIMRAFLEQVHQAALPIAQTPQQPARIAMLYPSEQRSDYWLRNRAAFEQRLKLLNIPYELKYFASRPSGDSRKQSKQLAEALAWKPDYLIFTLDVAHQNKMIEGVLSSKKTKIILQNITTPLSRWKRSPPFMYVGFDHAQGSQMIAERMLKDINYQGKYLMLYFTPGYISEMRGDTFVNEARKHPDVRQVGAFYTNNDLEKSYAATIATIEKHPDLKLIFSSSTDIALGALKALKETNRTDILLNGWGGGGPELEQLNDKGLDLTVMRMNDDSGIAMAEAIKLDTSGKTDQIPHIFAGDINLIDNRFSEEDIQRYKQKAFRLSGLPTEGQ